MIKGIHHVAFKCETQEQFDEMIYFYHELLGLPILKKVGFRNSFGLF